jgi:hypothetical protein
MPALHSAALVALAQQKTTLGLSAQAPILTCLRPLNKCYDNVNDSEVISEERPNPVAAANLHQ